MTESQQENLVRSLLRDAVTVCMITSHIEQACAGTVDFVDEFDVVLETAENWPASKWAELFVMVGRAPSEKLRNLVLSGLRQRLAVLGGVDG